MSTPKSIPTYPKILLLIALIAGCSSNDSRLAELAHHTSQQQTSQNKALAEQSQAVLLASRMVTSAAEELVKQDALARREMIETHGRLQQQNHAERTWLDRRRELLAMQQQASAQAAVRDPVIAQALVTLGLALAALLPLLVTALALSKLPSDQPDLEIVEIALRAGVASHPPNLSVPRASALPGDERPGLPSDCEP